MLRCPSEELPHGLPSPIHTHVGMHIDTRRAYGGTWTRGDRAKKGRDVYVYLQCRPDLCQLTDSAHPPRKLGRVKGRVIETTTKVHIAHTYAHVQAYDGECQSEMRNATRRSLQSHHVHNYYYEISMVPPDVCYALHHLDGCYGMSRPPTPSKCRKH